MFTTPHGLGCKCVVCTMTSEDYAKWGKYCLEGYGWYTHLVPQDQSDNTPTGFNAHTHYISKFLNHPDFQIVFPLRGELLMAIFHVLADRIKKGETFEPGKTYNLYLDKRERVEVRFAHAVECNRPVLRIILPDPSYETDREKMAEPYRRQWEGVLDAPFYTTN
jgi:hypothetical protein